MTCLLCRLYLRPTSHLDSLIAGDVAHQMVKEGKLHKDLLNLDAMEIAHEMTRKVCVSVCACIWCVCVCVCVCVVCVVCAYMLQCPLAQLASSSSSLTAIRNIPGH